MSSNRPDGQHDLIIVGGGIGGIISLKYAKDAGLDAILLEKGDAVGGLWRDKVAEYKKGLRFLSKPLILQLTIPPGSKPRVPGL